MDLAADGRPQELAVGFGVRAVAEALRDAGIAPSAAALVVGSNVEDRPRPVHELTAHLAEAAGITGPRLTVSLACASSAMALGLATELLEAGHVEVVVAGGTDVVTPRMFAGFHALHALAEERSTPFSLPYGMSLGDGAGFLVLESEDHARARGARVHGWLAGYGAASDAYHPTRPAPDGRGLRAAVVAALAHAGVDPAEVDYVNAHGTGTEANDAAEWRGVVAALPHAPAISSTKSPLGHTQGAAGALEVVVTLLAHRHDQVPPTRPGLGPRPGAPPEPLLGVRPRALPWHTAVSTNAAFGGMNTALVLGRHTRTTTPRPVWLQSVHLVHAGEGLDLPLRGRSADRDLSSRVPRTDLRAMDPTTRLLTTAVATALQSAGRLRRADLGRSGMVVGQPRVSARTLEVLQASLDTHGMDGVHVGAFVRGVLVSPAGACCEATGLTGPVDVFGSGPASGLLALVQSIHWLATRPLDRVIAAAVDEADSPHPEAFDGAAALLLTPTPGVARLAGVIGASGEGEALLCRLGATPDDRVLRVGHGACLVRAPPDHRAAMEGLVAVAVALDLVQRGLERAFVLMDDPLTASVAVALQREAAVL